MIFTDEKLQPTYTTFTSSETISKPTQYELSQEKYNLLNAVLYFNTAPYKTFKIL